MKTRITKSVSIILSIFENRSEAISVVNLVDKLNGQMNKTTVYRILDRLENDGVIHSFSGTNGLKWYAKCYKCTEHEHNDIHPHFECSNCGKVECLDINITIPKLDKRNVKSARILLTGYCANCMV